MIGHTKSGKPVYQSGNDEFPDWSAADHSDASEVHADAAASARYGAHKDASHDKAYAPKPSDERMHSRLSKEHEKRAKLKKSLDAGATQRIPNPNQPMHEMVKEKPTSAPNESRVVRPGPKPMFQKPPSTQRAPITPLPNKVGASTTAQTQKIPIVKALLVKANGEGSRGGKVIGHTKTGHPIYGHANVSKVDASHLKKWKSAITAYKKHLASLAGGDSSVFDAAVKARVKLDKLSNSGEVDREASEHLSNHVYGKSEGGLPSIKDAEEAGRIARETARQKERMNLDQDRPVTSGFEKELELMRLKKSAPNVKRIG